ncbi:MAG: PAS domain S-box protein, partial [Pseudomonadota bacterium]
MTKNVMREKRLKELVASTTRTSTALIVTYLILATGIITAGYFYYRTYEKNYKLGVEQQLSTITDLKVLEISQWRKERLGDASTIFKNPAFTKLVKRWFENPDDAETQALLQEWIFRLRDSFQYDRIRLVDAQLTTRMTMPAGAPPLSGVVSERAVETLRSGQIVFQDFYRNEYDLQIHLAIIIPIIEMQVNNRVLGLLLMRIDPEKYLYPLISSWPTPSLTAETLVVRRDGNDVLFLNDSRFKKNTALTLRFPLTNIDMPAVQAVLRQKGHFEGTDYRGEQVVADLRAVPDSPWFMVARMDITEVNAQLRHELRLIIFIVIALLIAAGISTAFLWRQQTTRFYKERYKTSEELRENEELYRLLFEGSRDGIFRVAGNGCFLDANRAFCDMLGYSLEELKAMKDFYSITPEKWRKWEHEEIWNNRLLKQGYSGVYEKEYIRKEGVVFPVELHSYVIFDENREPLYFWGVARNIAEHKHAESELVRLSTAVEQSDEAIVITDIDGTIQYANPSFERITGYATAEAIGHNPGFLKSGKQDTAFYEALWETISSGKVWKGHFINKRKDGTLYNEAATISPIKNAGGSITGYAAIKHDVTKEHALEEQLRQSQKMETIGTLAGGIAHDFNNILAGMLGFAEIAKDKVPKDSQLTYYLDQILRVGDRAVNLVNQILVFSRKSDSNRKPRELSPVIKEVLNFLRATLPKTIEVRQMLDQGSLVDADPTQIHQVVMNLCINAGHAMKEKGGTLK